MNITNSIKDISNYIQLIIIIIILFISLFVQGTNLPHTQNVNSKYKIQITNIPVNVTRTFTHIYMNEFYDIKIIRN